MQDFASELPENYYFSGGEDSFIPLLGIAALILAIIFCMSLPKKYVIVPFLLAGLLIPLKVGITIASININFNRILLLAVWSRILFRGECNHTSLNLFDKIIVINSLVNAVAFVIIWGEFGAVINRAGFLFTSLGTYFLLRCLIRNKEDIILLIKVLSAVVIVIAPPMLYEHVTGHNIFSLVGAREWSAVRDDRVRAGGPFAHAIIAGTFAAVLVPLFMGLYWDSPRNRITGTISILAVLIIIMASSSSTPVMSFAAGVLALSMWPLRKNMRLVRWVIVFILFGLQVLMPQPIWFLINRVAGLLGGSGWHRSMLIDNFVSNFSEWWLIGTNDNPNWGWSMWDVDNAYVASGLTGGLLGFILFSAIFIWGYRIIGSTRMAAEKSGKDEQFIWSLGSAFFAVSVAFLGIVFYDQSYIAWYSLLAVISAIGSFYKSEKFEISNNNEL